MTEQEETAKVGEMFMQRKSLKGRVAALEHEFMALAKEWGKLSHLAGAGNFAERYIIDGDEIRVMCPARFPGLQQERQYEKSLTISLKAFDREAITGLLVELSDTRKELEQVSRQLQPFN